MNLYCSDLHLTDRPRDSYRFGLFKWLRQQQNRWQPRATFILGDITDQKDRHSSTLVNKTIDGLTELKPPVYILMGNHDYNDPGNPFFAFLSMIEGITFVSKPYSPWEGYHMIPHCRDYDLFTKLCGRIPPKPDTLMVHQTFVGALAEAGVALKGLDLSPVRLLKPRACWAGDVHKAQRCGPVAYIGAPYSIKFGDPTKARVLLAGEGQEKNLYFDCPRKWSLTLTKGELPSADDRLKKGDQLKIVMRLGREDYATWPNIKKDIINDCKQSGFELYGAELDKGEAVTKEVIGGERQVLQPKALLTSYCKAEKIPKNIAQVGHLLLEE